MKRAIAILLAAVVAVVVNFFGVFFFFRPIAEADSGPGWIPPAVAGFLIYVLLSVLLLDRAVQRFGQPIRTGLLIAAAQIILVVDLTLRGERGIATAAAGAILILVTWTAMGFAYGKAFPGRTSNTAEPVAPGAR